MSGGREVIIGVVSDQTSGQLKFGLGRVYVEILKDVHYAIAPINESDAEEMITGIEACLRFY